MNDLWHVIVVLSGTLASLATYVWLREIKRVEAHDVLLDDYSVRIIRLEERSLTLAGLRAELAEVEGRVKEAIHSSDRHQSEAIGRVIAIAEKAHNRVDDLQRIINGA